MAPVLNHAPRRRQHAPGGTDGPADGRIYHGANRAALNLYRLIHKEARDGGQTEKRPRAVLCATRPASARFPLSISRRIGLARL